MANYFTDSTLTGQESLVRLNNLADEATLALETANKLIDTIVANLTNTHNQINIQLMQFFYCTRETTV